MDNIVLKEKILKTALADIPFDGWTINTFKQATQKAELEETMFDALFPRGIYDTLKFFSAWADDHMIEALKNVNPTPLPIRERVALAVQTRIEFLNTYKDCVRESAKILAKPQYARLATQITWDCADRIWDWAGDTSTDYNRYTKRGLLSGVIASTMLYWLQDESEDHAKTIEFLKRRIENVLFVGKNASKIIKPVASLIEGFIVRRKHNKEA